MGTALALASPVGYEPPVVAFGSDLEERNDVVWWVVVVGAAYAVALAYVAWCRHQGGNGEISFGWSGFKVACKSK